MYPVWLLHLAALGNLPRLRYLWRNQRLQLNRLLDGNATFCRVSMPCVESVLRLFRVSQGSGCALSPQLRAASRSISFPHQRVLWGRGTGQPSGDGLSSHSGSAARKGSYLLGGSPFRLLGLLQCLRAFRVRVVGGNHLRRRQSCQLGRRDRGYAFGPGGRCARAPLTRRFHVEWSSGRCRSGQP